MVVSPAQFRVLRALLHDGAGDRVLAGRLRCSVNTVKCHMKALYAATGYPDRTQLVVAVLRGRIKVTDIHMDEGDVA